MSSPIKVLKTNVSNLLNRNHRASSVHSTPSNQSEVDTNQSEFNEENQSDGSEGDTSTIATVDINTEIRFVPENTTNRVSWKYVGLRILTYINSFVGVFGGVYAIYNLYQLLLNDAAEFECITTIRKL